ncbi:PepSY domain-containing protein [Mesorhizobium sp. L-8-3]|uniref:PepSY domain-containing protein n=1 Tax=Mesorhizobium sp. L-8-3 TaxID=2744522 RepID=UPI0019274AA3|nr:PepSY domain-containing protein [Mesorhizobium sp. L-8-3]BCH23214.1 hypothetical protein MesoLjLb_29990 [Mesorhizobium sp. L-8-3]
MFHKAASTALCLFAVPASASAQDNSGFPPDNALKLSQIVTTVEKRPDFRYIYSIDWNDDGYYEVTYYTTDKAKVEINYNPVTGEPQ